MGEAGEVKQGLGGVPFWGGDGGRWCVAGAVEVAVGGEIVNVTAGGEDAEVGFESALEAGEGWVVGQQIAEGASGAGDYAA